MNTWMRLVMVGLLMTMGLMVMSGCLAVVAAAGAGTGVAYAKGDLTTMLDAQPAQIIAATEGAFEDLSMTRVSSGSTAVDGQAVARTAQDDKVTVKVEARSDSTSSISIRVGVFGNQALSIRLLDAIKARL